MYPSRDLRCLVYQLRYFFKEPQQNIHQRENIFEILYTVTKKNNTFEKNVIGDEPKSGGPFSSEKKKINVKYVFQEYDR